MVGLCFLPRKRCPQYSFYEDLLNGVGGSEIPTAARESFIEADRIMRHSGWIGGSRLDVTVAEIGRNVYE